MNRRILLPTLLLGALGLGALHLNNPAETVVYPDGAAVRYEGEQEHGTSPAGTWCEFVSYEEMGSAAPVTTDSPAWENGGECR